MGTWQLVLLFGLFAGYTAADSSRRERAHLASRSRVHASSLLAHSRPVLGRVERAASLESAACEATFAGNGACDESDEGDAAWPVAARRLRGGSSASARADDGQLVQLLDDHGGYTNASLAKYLAGRGMARNANYTVVSVLGPQSSGKSTLLNTLFGTRFDVMDASRGRSQTTKGAWVGKATGRDVVVLDMQGTDSREGGEDSKSFERQSALFALAVSDTLVINLWVHDLGRYNAANLHLLRTIIEVHLRLFGAGRRRLLFLCRDHVRSATPLAALEAMVRQDLEAIWRDVPKPAALADAELSAHFDVVVASLPHYELERSAWLLEAEQLRAAIEWRATPRPLVPADGLEPFTRSVWGTIVAERDLDLPSQREMLARFRCGEVADSAVAAVRNATAPLIKSLLAGGEPVSSLGVRLGTLLNASLFKYERVASLYEPSVASAKRTELRARLSEVAAAVLERQLDAAARRAERVHAASLAAAEVSADLELADRILRAEAAAASAYAAIARDALPPASGGWDLSGVLAAGEAALRSRLARLDAAARRDAAEATVAAAKASLSRRIEPRALSLLKALPADVWLRLAKGRAAVLANATAELSADLEALRVTGAQADAAVAELARESRDAIVRAARTEAEHAQDKARRRFETLFKLDETGLPRVWRQADDVNALCATAQEGARKVLELLAVLPADGPFEAVTLLDEGTRSALLQGLILEARSAYLGATQAQAALVPKARAPMWMLAVVGVVVARELLNLMPKFLMPSIVVQALSVMALGCLALLLLAKSAGPRVVVGAISLVSPGAARVAEKLLGMVGVGSGEAMAAAEVGVPRPRPVAAKAGGPRSAQSASTPGGGKAGGKGRAESPGEDFSD